LGGGLGNEHKWTGRKQNNDFKKTIMDLYHAGNLVKESSSEYGGQN